MEQRSDAEKITIKAILATERIVELNKRFRNIIRPRSTELNKLKVPSSQDNIILEEKSNIDNGVFLHNIKHFQQPKTRRIPFSKDPLLGHFSFGADSKEANNFVRETDHQLPHGTHPLAVDILKHVRPGKGNPDLVDTTATAGMLKEAFQVWPEPTYTSPRGTRLGHYKVWTRDYSG